VDLREVGGLRGASTADREFLSRVVKEQTAVGDAERDRKAAAKRSAEPQNTTRAAGDTILQVKEAGNEARAHVAKLGPAAATRVMCQAVRRGLDPEHWVETARIEAIIGSAPKSLGGVVSALRCWAAFADTMLGANGKHLPPSLNGLVAWSTLFGNSNTYGNYLGKIKHGCELAGVSVDLFHPFMNPSIKRAKAAIKKREPPPREKRFIRMEMTVKLSELAVQEGDYSSAMLYKVAYVFLNRVIDEALPIVIGNVGQADQQLPPKVHSCLSMVDKELVLRLAHRKNKPHGSVLRRTCWCKGGEMAKKCCPVHEVGRGMSSWQAGATPFKHLKGAAVLATLRRRLALLAVADAASYVTQDFRRGHARDLQANGATLAEILKAGEWKSPAFMSYLDLDKLETEAVIEAHLEESACED